MRQKKAASPTSGVEQIDIDDILQALCDHGDWIDYDSMFDGDYELTNCCGMNEEGPFPVDSSFRSAAKDLKVTEKYIEERYKDFIKESLSNINKKWPFIITLLTKKQSYTLTAIREWVKETQNKKFKFYNTTSGSTGSPLTIILYIV